MPINEQIVTDLKIPFLVHFTRTRNLPSIMRHGILPRDRFAEYEVEAEINDELRLDGRLDGISVSIAHPNSKMLWKLRQENSGVNWSVLAISPEVLWTHDCAFCKHNAADSRITSTPIEDLKTEAAFAELFNDHPGFDRVADGLKVFDPTDVQAEVLIFEPILPPQILGVAFQRPAIKKQYDPHFVGRKSVLHGDRGFFSDRRFLRLNPN